MSDNVIPELFDIYHPLTLEGQSVFQYALRHCDILCIELLSDLGLLMWGSADVCSALEEAKTARRDRH